MKMILDGSPVLEMSDEVVPTLVDAERRRRRSICDLAGQPFQYLQTISPDTRRRRITDIGAVTVRKNVLGWVTCTEVG